MKSGLSSSVVLTVAFVVVVVVAICIVEHRLIVHDGGSVVPCLELVAYTPSILAANILRRILRLSFTPCFCTTTSAPLAIDTLYLIPHASSCKALSLF